MSIMILIDSEQLCRDQQTTFQVFPSELFWGQPPSSKINFISEERPASSVQLPKLKRIVQLLYLFEWTLQDQIFERHVQDTIVPFLFDIRYTALNLRYSIYSADNIIAGKVKQNCYDYTLLLRMHARKEAIPDLQYIDRDFPGWKVARCPLKFLHVDFSHSAWFYL